MVRSPPSQRPNPLGDITNTQFPTRSKSPNTPNDDGSLGTDRHSTGPCRDDVDDGSSASSAPTARHNYNGEFSFFLPNRDETIRVAADDEAAESTAKNPQQQQNVLYEEADVSLALIDSGLLGIDDIQDEAEDSSDDISTSDVASAIASDSESDDESTINPSMLSRRRNYPVGRLSIRERANQCDWGNTKSILKWFPYWGDKSRYGRRAPPREMLVNLSPFAKAKAVCAWRRLSPNQQSATKKQFTLIAKQRREFESSLMKAEKALEREEKRQQQKMEKAIIRRRKQIQKQKKKYDIEFDRAILRESDKMDAFEDKLTRALTKIDDKMKEKEQKKRAREANQAVAKRARIEEETPNITSVFLDSQDKANTSASHAQLQKRSTQQSRHLYEPPSRSSHLSDKKTRRAIQILNNQFYKTARSFTPPPDIDSSNWATKKQILVDIDGTTKLPRFSRPSKNTNIIPVSAQATASINATFRPSSGGQETTDELFELMLQSGRYDNIVRQYLERTTTQAPIRTVNLETLTEQQSAQLHLTEQSERAIAERRRNSDDLRHDETIGAVTEEIQL